jgi:2',3'-cyclic-nucleotide 2'-phosphodiesterase (5'-nucleotidase family)
MAIYFTNDFHSHVPNSIAFLNGIAQIKKTSGNLLIDLGDFTEGSAFYLQFKGKPELEIIARLYDLIIPGNHGFGDVVTLFNNGFNVVNSNIYKNNKLFFNESYIYKDSVFLGIMSPDAFRSIELHKRKEYNIIDPYLIMPKLIRKYRNYKIILLSHSGFDYDSQLASKIHGIDLILSSHCHSKNYESIVHKTVIAKALEEGKGYGKVTYYNNHFKIDFLKCKENESKFKAPIFYLNKKVKTYNKLLSGIELNNDEAIFIRSKNRKQIAKYFADYIKISFDVDNCLINYDMFRGNLHSSILTLKDIYNYCPLENTLVIIQDTRNNITNNLLKIPVEMKKSICESNPLPKTKKELKIITTSYLADNFLACKSKNSYNTKLQIQNIFIKYLRNLK